MEVDEHAVALWRELVDNSVECELCNEPYDDDDGDEGHIPRLLTCGHTYCQVGPFYPDYPFPSLHK